MFYANYVRDQEKPVIVNVPMAMVLYNKNILYKCSIQI